MSGMSRRQFVHAMGASAAWLAGASPALAADAPSPAPRPAGPIRFGVQTAPQHVTYQQIADTWKLAEELGYDSAFTFEIASTTFMPSTTWPKIV